MIVFGIRFALFCYLPIHSITLNFVTTTFVIGMVWWLVFARVISHTINRTLTIHGEAPLYTHSILLFSVHALRLSETEKAIITTATTITAAAAVAATNYMYCIFIRLAYHARVTVSHDKRER